MKKIVIAASAVILVAVAAVGFYACKKETFSKEGTVKSHVLTSYYDEGLLAQFMDEPLVCQLREVIHSYQLSVRNGILAFRNEKDFNEVYDTLIYFSNQWDELVENNPSQYDPYIQSEAFPDFPMLYAFEVFTDFYSLRAKIDREVLEMQAREGIDEKGNPDNHYTVSDYFRTLLSPDCESIIGDRILLYGEYQNLIIQNLDFNKLAEVKALWHQYGETDGTVTAFERQLAVDMDAVNWKSGENPCPPCSTLVIHQFIPYHMDCPHTYSFDATLDGKIVDIPSWSTSTSPCDIQSVKWNFGDGTTSTELNPKHTYSNGGFYTVKYSIKRRDGSTCETEKRIEVKDCSVNITEAVEDPDYQGCGVRYKFRATPYHCNNQSVISYTLSFPGTSIPPQTQTSRDFTQVFTCNQKYKYEITVQFADGCTNRDEKTINIKNAGDCMLKKDHQKHKDINTCSSYKINHLFRIYSVGGLNRVYVKNVHYKKNGVGWWILKKASTMNVSFGGNVVYQIVLNGEKIFDCNTTTPVYPNGKRNSNKSIILYDYPMRQAFRVKKESVYSSWGVQSSNSCSWASNSCEIKLHAGPCN